MYHHQQNSVRKQFVEVVMHLLNALSAMIDCIDLAFEKTWVRRSVIISIIVIVIFFWHNVYISVDMKPVQSATVASVLKNQRNKNSIALMIDPTSFDLSSDLHHTIRIYYGKKYRLQLLSAWNRVYRRSQKYADIFDRVADELDIPVVLLKGIAARESMMQAYVVSPVGAQGLMQVMPSHYPFHHQAAEWCGDERYNWYNPCHNIYAGALVYKSALFQAEGDTLLALMMYHMGENHQIFRNSRQVGANSFLSVYHAQKNDEKYYALEVMSWALAFASYETFGRIQPMYKAQDLKMFTDQVNVASLLKLYPAETPVE